MTSRTSRLAILLACLSLSACGDGVGPGPTGRIGIVARPVTTTHDTVGTLLPGTLTLIVYDTTGKRAPNAGVSLRVVGVKVGDPSGDALFVRAAGGNFWWTLFNSTNSMPIGFSTDSLGVLRLEVQLGGVAKTVSVELDAFNDKARGTIQFDVKPGAPVALWSLPRDTAVYAGHHYQLRANLVDRYGNRRSEAASVTSDSSAATSTAAGVVSGQRVGRALLRATGYGFSDSVWVSVVPPGTIAATRPLGQLVRFDLDGSDLRVMSNEGVRYVSWAPSGARMVLNVFRDVPHASCFGGDGYMVLRDTLGAERSILPLESCPAGFQIQGNPHFDAQETWVYFDHVRNDGSGAYGPFIRRVHPDGSGLESVLATGDTAAILGTHPAPSPDGRYVAYLRDSLQILDLQTGTTASVDIPGQPYLTLTQPVWIPGTNTVVVASGSGFLLVLPNGTPVRTVPYGIPYYGSEIPAFDISPDGHWIAMRVARPLPPAGDGGRIYLVNLDTGMLLPLDFTSDMGTPSWRP